MESEYILHPKTGIIIRPFHTYKFGPGCTGSAHFALPLLEEKKITALQARLGKIASSHSEALKAALKEKGLLSRLLENVGFTVRLAKTKPHKLPDGEPVEPFCVVKVAAEATGKKAEEDNEARLLVREHFDRLHAGIGSALNEYIAKNHREYLKALLKRKMDGGKPYDN